MKEVETLVQSSSTEAEERRSKWGAVKLSIASNSLLVLLKVGAGLWTASVSVLSEAVHSGIDMAAAMIAAFGVRSATRPPDESHHFGHGKFENLSGTLEALLIFVAAAYIVVESVDKLIHGVELAHVEAGIGVMALSAIINLAVSRKLMRVARETDSIALEADALHLRTDVYTSGGVFLTLGLIYLSKILVQDPRWRALIHYLDPLAALAVAVLIVKAAYELTRRSMAGLLDRPLPEEEDRIIRHVLETYKGHILEFHDLRHRKSGSERHIDLHLVMAKDTALEKVHSLCDEIEREIQRRLPRSKVLIHVEPCDESCPTCKSRVICSGEDEEVTPP